MLVILSRDDDFSAVLAEHAARELQVEVCVAESREKLEALAPQLIVSQEKIPHAQAPVLVVNEKPVRLQTLLEKIRTTLARAELPLGGEFMFSPQQKIIGHPMKEPVALTDKETQLLMLLLKNRRGVAKDMLLKQVWGVSHELESHTLETHIYRLRAKLKEAGAPASIHASPGQYELSVG